MVEALVDLGGRAARRDVLDAMESLFSDRLTPEDVEPVESRPFEVKWRNRTSWERDRMVKEGVLIPGVSEWALSGDVLERVRQAQAPIRPEDLLANFRPKNSEEYRQRVVGRTLIKERAHEQLISDFGHHVASNGHTPRTNVHPRDLVVVAGHIEWLVEAKVLYNGNASQAVRAAIGQLYEYAFMLYDDPESARLLALFSEPIGLRYVELLESINIAAIWRFGGRWTASVSATGLV